MSAEHTRYLQAREEFVTQWGALGTQWGINRTMAQIHALLMTSPHPLCTDDVMQALSVSRGNAHTNLKELLNWGLIRAIALKGERREFFEAEKDVWQIFTIVTRERKRREIDPALQLIQKCAAETQDLTSPEAKAFYDQMSQLEDFVSFTSKMADRVSTMKYTFALQMAAKLLS